jgi:hypothetical protein
VFENILPSLFVDISILFSSLGGLFITYPIFFLNLLRP